MGIPGAPPPQAVTDTDAEEDGKAVPATLLPWGQGGGILMVILLPLTSWE